MSDNKNTVVVLADPQVEFLKPAGGGFGLTRDILGKYNMTENMVEMVKQVKEKRYKLFISPYYFYPHGYKWQLGGTGEHAVLEQQVFARKSQHEPVEEGSGADFIEELKPYLDENMIISSPYKISGPESNDLALQSGKNGIDIVILDGMNGNLCSDSHMRELVEGGFSVVIATDTIDAPDRETVDVALTNFGFIADQVMTTEEILEQLSQDRNCFYPRSPRTNEYLATREQFYSEGCVKQLGMVLSKRLGK